MNAKEFELAKESSAIEALLDSVANVKFNASQSTAYNFLIDYLENPEWFSSHEGGRLLLLSLEVLKDIHEKS
jgi:hypothetical protein